LALFRNVMVAAVIGGLALSGAGGALAKKSKHHKRSQFSASQREQILTNARKKCRAKFGVSSNVYRIDYYTGQVWCWQ
jgi:hypothetical protein